MGNCSGSRTRCQEEDQVVLEDSRGATRVVVATAQCRGSWSQCGSRGLAQRNSHRNGALDGHQMAERRLARGRGAGLLEEI